MPEVQIKQNIIIEMTQNENARKVYIKPQLQELGDLRAVTLGPTPGNGESGNPFVLLGKD